MIGDYAACRALVSVRAVCPVAGYDLHLAVERDIFRPFGAAVIFVAAEPLLVDVSVVKNFSAWSSETFFKVSVQAVFT